MVASATSSLNFGVEPLQFHAGVFDAELPVDAALLGMGSEASQQAPKSATPILSLEVALACDRCNAHKGANLTGIDPDTGSIVPLFNPRVHVWEDHFVLSGVTIVGLTAMGC